MDPLAICYTREQPVTEYVSVETHLLDSVSDRSIQRRCSLFVTYVTSYKLSASRVPKIEIAAVTGVQVGLRMAPFLYALTSSYINRFSRLFLGFNCCL